ncbi:MULTISPECIES: SDR family oxidoreductase [unclassified Nocardiopsis]|uniref:SDR family oxidoreductase n=1 Tax=Nocardiopsis TaxID=2013 RepID=UPI00387B5A0E
MTKVVVIGGTGLIGSGIVGELTAQGHEAVAAAPNTGVDTLTGEGLAEALEGASVLIDVSNSPSFEERAVMDFFTTSTTNLLRESAKAGVEHYVALSIVGTERWESNPYFRAKIAQEALITGSDLPYSIVHATQFFEFARAIADEATVDGVARVADTVMRPIAAADVSAAVAAVALGAPTGGVTEVAGPEEITMEDLVRARLAIDDDPREVVAGRENPYFGAVVEPGALLPGEGATIATTLYKDWLAAQTAR